MSDDRRWRLLAHDRVLADEGLALDEGLMAGYHRGAPDRPPTLRLYTYADHAALVGRFQHLDAEVDLDACRRTGTGVNRRPTGGGAIVMGAGQLGVALITRAPAAQRPKELLERYATGIQLGLAELGIDTNFRGKNDLEAGGRKIAGLGLYLDGNGGFLFHSSVLADLDVGFMLEVLRIPAAKLGDKAAAAVGERVTTVTGETGDAWDGAALRHVIATGFAKALEIELEVAEVDPAEAAAAEALLARKYRTTEWLAQRTPHPDATGTALLKTPSGLVRLYLALNGATIKSALFTGDFNELPPALARFEEALRWKSLDAADVARAARAARIDDELGLSTDELVAVVLDAGDRAAGRQVAAPTRLGSCYFPEKEAAG
ncbi:MAG TPA: biotin/lipoate A/B protein ligase family protein [Acidimicrobiales bacterium]|nr:biotin/lipoate A/B protein ligase family protein [Acidimicrobiales bacterium]